MKKIQLLLSALLLVTTGSALAGGDAAAGEKKAMLCMSCHGAKGISASPLWPNLAGQKDAYLVKQLKDFKKGAREDSMMVMMAKQLSEDDMENLAAYYSSLPGVSAK